MHEGGWDSQLRQLNPPTHPVNNASGTHPPPTHLPSTRPSCHPPTWRLQKGAWSPAFHAFCPPAFKEATEELLRISRKHGARLGLTHNLLVDLLLPVLAEDMSPWL